MKADDHNHRCTCNNIFLQEAVIEYVKKMTMEQIRALETDKDTIERLLALKSELDRMNR